MDSMINSRCFGCNVTDSQLSRLDCEHQFCMMCIKEMFSVSLVRCLNCKAPVNGSTFKGLVKIINENPIYKLRTENQISYSTIAWAYQGTSGYFWIYPKEIIDMLNKGGSTVEVTMNDDKLIIDIDKMIEYSIRRPDFTKKIIRIKNVDANVLKEYKIIGVSGKIF